MSEHPSGGYFGVSKMWHGEPNAVGKQNSFWDKIDALGVFFLRFSVILWIISIIISILTWIMVRNISDKLSQRRTRILDSSTNNIESTM